jgi:hypothetical protein
MYPDFSRLGSKVVDVAYVCTVASAALFIQELKVDHARLAP